MRYLPPIAHMVLSALAFAPLTAPPVPCAASPSAPVVRELRPLSVRGVNYHPSLTPWDGTWTRTPSDVFDRDMALAASLNINAVRIGLPWNEKTEAAGFVAADGTVQPAYLQRFEEFLTTAWKHGIRVVPVLALEFHTPKPRGPEAAKWRRARQGFIGPHRDDGRVLLWDLMNEPERHQWSAESLAFLREAIPYAKILDPNHLTTVGMGWQADRLVEAGVPDVTQYHNYAPKAEMFAEGTRRVGKTLEMLRKYCGNRPILIGEFGMATARDPVHGAGSRWEGRLTTAPGTEEEQLRLYQVTLDAAEQYRLAGVMPWCLLTHPTEESGWLTPEQSMFGLVRLDGSLKPAALLLRKTYARWKRLEPAP